MKIINDALVEANAASKAAAGYDKYRDAVLAAIDGKEVVAFDDVRAAMGKDKAQLPDGHIHQIALDAGLRVERE